MQELFKIVIGAASFAIAACASAPASDETSLISRAEAKAHACPEHILAAGASPKDCECVADELYKLGQDGQALSAQESIVYEAFEGSANERDVVIGVVRLDAFETCGFFEDDHPVNKNLGSSGQL